MSASIRTNVACDGVWDETLLSRMSGLYAGECIVRGRASLSADTADPSSVRRTLASSSGWVSTEINGETLDQCAQCHELSPVPTEVAI